MSAPVVVQLEVTQEQLDLLATSSHVAIVQYEDAETGAVKRSWVEHVGTEAECAAVCEEKSKGMYIVPTGVAIAAFVKTTAELVRAEETPHA